VEYNTEQHNAHEVRACAVPGPAAYSQLGLILWLANPPAAEAVEPKRVE